MNEEIILNFSFVTYTWQIITPLIFSLADIITGYLQALINKKLSSKKMREGLLRKCMLLIILVLGYVLQFSLGIPHIATTIAVYIVFMEFLSIIENLTKAGINIGKLANILKIKGEDDNEGN